MNPTTPRSPKPTAPRQMWANHDMSYAQTLGTYELKRPVIVFFRDAASVEALAQRLARNQRPFFEKADKKFQSWCINQAKGDLACIGLVPVQARRKENNMNDNPFTRPSAVEHFNAVAEALSGQPLSNKLTAENAELRKQNDWLELNNCMYHGDKSAESSVVTELRAEVGRFKKERKKVIDALNVAADAGGFDRYSDDVELIRSVTSHWDRLLVIWHKEIEQRNAWQACAKRIKAANKSLSELSENKVTYYEESPTKNVECHRRWGELNGALAAFGALNAEEHK